MEEAVSCPQIDLWSRRPSYQQRLQHARRGRLAARHRACDADDVGDLAVADTEELALRIIKPLRGIDIDRQQARQRQIDFLDLPDVEAVVERAHAGELPGLQRPPRVRAPRRPPVPPEDGGRGVSLFWGGGIPVAVFPILVAPARRL